MVQKADVGARDGLEGVCQDLLAGGPSIHVLLVVVMIKVEG